MGNGEKNNERAWTTSVFSYGAALSYDFSQDEYNSAAAARPKIDGRAPWMFIVLRCGVTVSIKPFQGSDPGSTPGIGTITVLAQLVERVAFRGVSPQRPQCRGFNPRRRYFFSEVDGWGKIEAGVPRAARTLHHVYDCLWLHRVHLCL